MTIDRTSRAGQEQEEHAQRKQTGQNKSGEQGSLNSGHHLRKPPGMEGNA